MDGEHVYVQAGGSFVKLNKRNGETVWRSLEDSGGMNGSAFSSPFKATIAGQTQLLVQTRERLAGVDEATGQERWVTTPFGKYWSLVAQGQKILALDERGDLLLINANPEKFELLGQRHVSDSPTWAHLAVCGDEVFVRDLKGLTVYRWATGTK